MKKILVILAALFFGAPAYGQQVNLYCNLGTGGLNPWQPCSAANPLAVSATVTPSGTQNVNLTQILSAAPSLTNPLWVFPATGATFPVSGTVAVTQSTSPWVVSNGGTFAVQAAITAASGAYASGSISSGAFASGAIGSGAVASGAFASGSIASGAIAAGAQVDLLTMRGTKAAGTAAANSILGGIVFNSTAPTLTDGQQAAAQADTAGSHQVNTEGKKATYSASAAVVLAASATDVFTITGSASKTIRVNRVSVTGKATAASVFSVDLTKRSTANSGGTSSAPNIVPHDSANAAASATVLAYSANPTVGTLVGVVRLQLLAFTTAATTAIAPSPLVWDFTTRNGQAVVLRGTGQVLAFSLEAQTVTGGAVFIEIEWTEE